MTPAEIGQIVRAARRAQGLRQDQLAGAAGVGVRFVSELERGKATVRLEKLLAVLGTLGCKVRVELPGGATATNEGAAPGCRRGSRRGQAGAVLLRMTDSLNVWWDRAIVGLLSLNRDGAVRFTYDRDWIEDASAPPISFSLPRQPRSFSPRLCLPFFEGLLPEGAQRDGAAAGLGVSPTNTFRLLAGMGAELAGALSLLPEGEEPSDAETDPAPDALSGDELARLLETIRQRPFLAGMAKGPGSHVRGAADGLRMSLAGAQSKIPVVLVDGRIALPVPGQATTHILKPPMPDLEATTESEAFAMCLAADLGLAVAPVRPQVVAGMPYLLVERYDRQAAPQGPVNRLHQEDFCQALGLVPQRKYASEGGPGFPHCFGLIRRVCARPAIALLGLLDAAILQVLLGNADAHGKNYSLLRQPDGDVGLAPLYDLLSTIAYPRFSPGFAMKIAGRSTLQEFRHGDWDRFARQCGLGAPFVRQRVAELCDLAHGRSHTVAEKLVGTGLDEDALANRAALVENRATLLARTVP